MQWWSFVSWGGLSVEQLNQGQQLDVVQEDLDDHTRALVICRIAGHVALCTNMCVDMCLDRHMLRHMHARARIRSCACVRAYASVHSDLDHLCNDTKEHQWPNTEYRNV